MATIDIDDATLRLLKAEIANVGPVANAPEVNGLLDQIESEPDPVEFQTVRLKVVDVENAGLELLRVSGDMRSVVEGKFVSFDSGKHLGPISAEYDFMKDITTLTFASGSGVLDAQFFDVTTIAAPSPVVAPISLFSRIVSFFTS